MMETVNLVLEIIFTEVKGKKKIKESQGEYSQDTHQNNPEDIHLKTVKCRAIHTYELILKCVINKIALCCNYSLC